MLPWYYRWLYPASPVPHAPYYYSFRHSRSSGSTFDGSLHRSRPPPGWAEAYNRDTEPNWVGSRSHSRQYSRSFLPGLRIGYPIKSTKDVTFILFSWDSDIWESSQGSTFPLQSFISRVNPGSACSTLPYQRWSLHGPRQTTEAQPCQVRFELTYSNGD